MMMRFGYYTILLLLAAQGCLPVKKSATKGAQPGKYYEDLSQYRPSSEAKVASDTIKNSSVKRDAKKYVDPKFAVNKKLDSVLDSIDRINLNRKFIDGFTIQVYSGLKRDEALNVKRDLTMFLPNIPADVHYNQPNFRVKAGRYFNQLEAQKAFQLIKRNFPNAIIVPDKIALN